MVKSMIEPYVFFGGRCEEALEFYKSAIGAEVPMMMRFGESPEPIPEEHRFPGYEQKIMHASMMIDGQRIMASDGCGSENGMQGFALALQVATAAEAERYFKGLADGGVVAMPLTETFWSPLYGMLTDRFGVAWMVMVQTEDCA